MIPQNQTYVNNGVTYVKDAYFKFLRDNDLIVDASAGGLVSGPTKAEGGITLIGCNKDGDVFIAGQTEGWQFLVNAFAEFENSEALTQMSNHLLIADQLFMSYSVPSHIQVLTVTPREIQGQIITPVLFHCTNQIGTMPRVPAKANLNYLDTLNRAAWLEHYIEKQPTGTMRETARITRFVAGSSDN